MNTKITILGSGNVAWHLARKWHTEGVTISQVYSRNEETGTELAKAINADYISEIEAINENSDIYIFMLSDAGNAEIINKIVIPNNKIFIHTSGSLEIEIFKEKTKYYGVIYPFQTFSRSAKITDFKAIPICIEASDLKTYETIKELAEKISPQIFSLNNEQRKLLHISGIFACNFMNHSVFLGQKILKDNNIPTEIITPLLKQSFSKILEIGAENSQTGPAIRNDNEVICSHTELLKRILGNRYTEIYEMMSNSIYKTYHKDGKKEN